MPVRFSRLRIAGFKSFAEPQVVEIRPGLTGIVGPNGCGKSNVVEALRWAMGEGSARSLRGGEMDDVIFAGTAARASRNLAEVTVSLEETAGAAPPPFHEQPELEIVRRIERGMGSHYRVNGREARARDVQTLFADLASGARSSAMVSQGRVGAIVNARPDERRAVLEEAAGITGLHARRHEAEIRLRAAEANLVRAEDVRAGLEAQLVSLRKQAKQANRYRTITGTIRDAERDLLSVQRALVQSKLHEAAAILHAARSEAADATALATAAGARAAEAASALPALRQAEAEARTLLERARLAREQVAAEAARARAALADAEKRARELAADHAHAAQLSTSATHADERLRDEAAVLRTADDDHAERSAEAEAALALAIEALAAAEAAANDATHRAASAEAERGAAERARAEADARLRRLSDQLARLSDERAKAAALAVDGGTLAVTIADHAEAEAAVKQARLAQDEAEHARADAAARLAVARAAASESDGQRRRVSAEAGALAEVLGSAGTNAGTPMIDLLTVPPGYEAAIGAAFDDSLNATDDAAAARHWRLLGDAPAATLPAGATSLAEIVQAPPALGRALAHVGFVEDAAAGLAAQPALSPGQMLVSRDGGGWRWDGFCVRSGAEGAAAVRLRQRNRLDALRSALTEAEARSAAAKEAETVTFAEERRAVAAEAEVRNARRSAEHRVESARAAESRIRSQDASATARLTGLDDQIAHLTPERDDAAEAARRGVLATGSLPPTDGLRTALADARSALIAARAAEHATRAARDAMVRDHAARARRLVTIEAERAQWTERARDAAERATDLAARLAEAEAAQAALASAPGSIAGRDRAAIGALATAESAHAESAESLMSATDAETAAGRAARSSEQSLSSAREAVVRAEGVVAQAEQAVAVMSARVEERLGPDAALPDPPHDAGPETEERARRKHERLLRERDEMGPVNLCAEQEADDVERQASAIVAESEELTTAIAKLRGSIGHINREGREKLGAVFADIDKHFQQLFARMFGGGRAHLALVGSDDPLTAGLEIFAQPPGKKLATLSLLSGGEQALTALSLIFAVFRCNPAPICVLDEVDAPLDDANVERFCALLDDMVRETGTRFLVVTHHQMTMARMDRLYGVTMQERGVSRLLSVDLGTAAAMVEQPQPRMMAAE